MTRIIYIICFLFLSLVIHAQDDGERIPFREIAIDTSQQVFQDLSILFKNTPHGLKVRWGASNPTTWLQGNQYGYTVERLEIDSLNQNPFEKVGQGLFKPWPLADWEPIVSDERPYTAAAAMAIHGESKDAQTGFIAEAQDLENRFGFALLSADLDWGAAVASGLGYLDQDIEEDKLYVYRVYVNGPSETTFDTAYDVAIKADIYDNYPVQMEPLVEGENKITLEWSYNPQSPFSAYHIERSNDQMNWERLTEQPYIDTRTNLDKGGKFVSYQDSVDINYLKYYYRVIGLDAFGEESGPSEIVEGMGRDRTNPSAPIEVLVEEVEKGALTLTWKWNSTSIDNDFKGFYIYKSLDVYEQFTRLNNELLPAGTSSYVDVDPDARETNYYYIAAVDEEGNEGRSVIGFGITKDDIPPGPPANLQAEVDTNGLLLLQWDPPADNDIRGYQVLYSNAQNGEFGARSTNYLPEHHFVDSISLKTLTKNIFYYVIAIDYSYNQSEPSEILKVKRPDIIPPEASIFTDYEVTEKGIYFKWLKSSSNDVAQVELHKKIGDKRYVAISNFDENSDEYLDSDVEGGQIYSYKLRTIDLDGNEQFPEKPLVLEALTPFFIAAIENPSAENIDSGLRLTWQYEEVPYVEFIVYKGQDEASLSTYKKIINQYSLDIPQSDFSNNSGFWIKAKTKDGRESKLVKVNI